MVEFLELPPEIREEIYKHVFRGARVRWAHVDNLCKLTPLTPLKSPATFGGLQLMMTNKLIYKESNDHFFNESRFNLGEAHQYYQIWDFLQLRLKELQKTNPLATNIPQNSMLHSIVILQNYVSAPMSVTYSYSKTKLRSINYKRMNDEVYRVRMVKNCLHDMIHRLLPSLNLEVRVLTTVQTAINSDDLNLSIDHRFQPPACFGPPISTNTQDNTTGYCKHFECLKPAKFKIDFTLATCTGKYGKGHHWVYTNVQYSYESRSVTVSEIDHVSAAWTTSVNGFKKDVLEQMTGRQVALDRERENTLRNYLLPSEKEDITQGIIQAFQGKEELEVKWENVLHGPVIFLSDIRAAAKRPRMLQSVHA